MFLIIAKYRPFVNTIAIFSLLGSLLGGASVFAQTSSTDINTLDDFIAAIEQKLDTADHTGEISASIKTIDQTITGLETEIKNNYFGNSTREEVKKIWREIKKLLVDRKKELEQDLKLLLEIKARGEKDGKLTAADIKAIKQIAEKLKKGAEVIEKKINDPRKGIIYIVSIAPIPDIRLDDVSGLRALFGDGKDAAGQRLQPTGEDNHGWPIAGSDDSGWPLYVYNYDNIRANIEYLQRQQKIFGEVARNGVTFAASDVPMPPPRPDTTNRQRQQERIKLLQEENKRLEEQIKKLEEENKKLRESDVRQSAMPFRTTFLAAIGGRQNNSDLDKQEQAAREQNKKLKEKLKALQQEHDRLKYQQTIGNLPKLLERYKNAQLEIQNATEEIARAGLEIKKLQRLPIYGPRKQTYIRQWEEYIAGLEEKIGNQEIESSYIKADIEALSRQSSGVVPLLPPEALDNEPLGGKVEPPGPENPPRPSSDNQGRGIRYPSHSRGLLQL